MKKALLIIIIAAMLLLFGCVTEDSIIKDIAKSSGAISSFLAEYPNAEVTVQLLKKDVVAADLDFISYCKNVESNEYYKVTFTDGFSGLKAFAFIDGNKEIGIVCTYNEKCVMTSCGGLEITCGTESPACLMVVQSGDVCKKYASCEIIVGTCQPVLDNKFMQCKSCVENCSAIYPPKSNLDFNYECEQKCVETIDSDPCNWGPPKEGQTTCQAILSPGYYYDSKNVAQTTSCKYFPGGSGCSNPPFKTFEECQKACENKRYKCETDSNCEKKAGVWEKWGCNQGCYLKDTNIDLERCGDIKFELLAGECKCKNNICQIDTNSTA